MWLFKAKTISKEEILVNLVDTIINSSLLTANRLTEDLDVNDEKENNKFIAINIESLCFFLHFTNRIAYAEIGDPKRGVLMDKLASLIIPSYVKAQFRLTPHEGITTLEELIQDHLNLVEEEYSQYKFLPDKNIIGPKSTLVWEFSKKITSLSKHSHNPEVIRQMLAITTNTLAKMPFQKLLKYYGDTLLS